MLLQLNLWKMELWKFVGLFVAITLVCTKANPLPRRAVADEREANSQEQISSVDSTANTATRQAGRQGRQGYYGYDYPFAYPSYYNSYYPDYSNSEYYNPYRRPNKQQKSKRRQFNNRQTTQRYSVWDLSRK